jgi:hypothetical protein
MIRKRLFISASDFIRRCDTFLKFHNIQIYLYNLHASPNVVRVIIKSRRMRWARDVAHVGDVTNAYRILVGKPERKRPCRIPRGRWEDNNEIGKGKVDSVL